LRSLQSSAHAGLDADAAQLGLDIALHALRATAATNALDHQADIAKVQEWLGHANRQHRHHPDLRSPQDPA
jgi:integrase